MPEDTPPAPRPQPVHDRPPACWLCGTDRADEATPPLRIPPCLPCSYRQSRLHLAVALLFHLVHLVHFVHLKFAVLLGLLLAHLIAGHLIVAHFVAGGFIVSLLILRKSRNARQCGEHSQAGQTHDHSFSHSCFLLLKKNLVGRPGHFVHARPRMPGHYTIDTVKWL